MIIGMEQLPSIRDKHQKDSLVFARGVYDLFHEGHLACLNWSAQQGDTLVVGVSTDERVRRRKGPSRPVIGQAGRLAIVSSIKVVDYAFLTEGGYDPQTPASLVAAKLLRPDVVVLSNDCSPCEESVWNESLAGTGIQVLRHPEALRITSTSEIIQRIKES